MVIAGRLDKDFIPTYYVLALGVMPYPLYKLISVSQLLLLPQVVEHTHATDTANELLDCLASSVPGLTVGDMHRCVNTTTVYNVTKSHIPFMWFTPIAFVFPDVFEDRMFMVDEYYTSQSVLNQALIIIHECTHLALHTRDYAYRWQADFHMLTDQQHEHNADSYVDAIVHHCLNDIVVSF